VTGIYRLATSLIYLCIAASMLLAAGTIVVWAVWNAVAHLSMEEAWIGEVLTSIGALVVALAIVDVANYMFEEEIFRSSELRSPGESRKTLTKISVIIIIAINLEALVYVFKAGDQDIRLLVYPAILVTASGVVMLFLGLYQRISISAELVDPSPHDEEAERGGE
jgi:hypothetical protein